MKPTPRLTEQHAKRTAPPITYPVVQAAAELSISQRTLRRWIQDGVIASYKERGLRFVSRQAIEE